MKKLLIALALILGFVSVASAHPPTDLQLNYDLTTGILNVKMKHITLDHKDHYVRFINVKINQNEPQVFRYTRQDSPAVVEVLLPVAAKAGDIISVEAVCSKGGKVDGSLSIPKEEKKNSANLSEAEPKDAYDESEDEPAPAY